MSGLRSDVLRLGAVLLALAGPGCRPRPAPRRSLVLVVIDTLRRDHLATYGYERDTAPELGRLAAEGAVLDGVSPTSWTQPAVASLLTGLHPVRHQSIRTEPLPPQADTLAERLARRGYATLGVSANGFITPDWGFDQGFDELLALRVSGAGLRLPVAAQVNEAVLARLSSLRPPFFLYVHYVDPHAPYAPSVAWNGGPLGDHLQRRGPVEITDLDAAKYAHRDDTLLRDCVDLYDGEVRQADAGVAELLATLRGKGLLEGAVTIVAGDHGEEFQDHGRMSHGQSLYEEVLRVPLIVHAPGLVAPGVRHGTASLLDVVPTALDLLGVALEGPALDGVDLAPFLTRGRRYDDPDRLFLAHLDTAENAGLAVSLGRHKLILSRPYRKQLFELGTSRGEKDNTIESQGALAADLARRLAQAYNDMSRSALPRVRTVMTSDQGAALAALGYVASAAPEARSIAPRIRPASPGDDGLLGWEDLASLDSCVETADPGAASQLLDGWYHIELEGRWTWPRASALLAVPEGSRHALTLKGVNHERGPLRFRVSVAGHGGLERTVPPGPFSAELRLGGGGASGPWVVTIERPQAFVPARVGLADDRVLGVFVTSLCLD